MNVIVCMNVIAWNSMGLVKINIEKSNRKSNWIYGIIINAGKIFFW